MAILVFSPNGTYVAKPTLEVARTSADCAGKTIVVTSALTTAQSDITAAWPADRALEVKKGGSIANTAAFTINGSFSAGMYTVFSGTGSVVFGSRSVNVAYPEWFGAVADGLTNDTLAIQKVLDSGAVQVVFTHLYLTSGNDVSSNSHLLFTKSSQLNLANAANRPALQNKNFVKANWGTSTFGLDSNITIEGLNLDGNQANQVHTGTGIYAGEYTSGVRMFGVTNLVLKNCRVQYAKTFGIWLCAINNLIAHDLSINQYIGDLPANQDGLHINGPASKLSIKNIVGTTYDDMIALNADDGSLGANVTNGNIIDAIIDGVYPDNCLNGIRLLSAVSRMDRIIVKNVVGTTRDVAVNQSPFGLGAGNVGALLIDSIDVQCSNGYAGGDYYAVIAIGGAIESVTISNVTRCRNTDNRPLILVASDANIGSLCISNVSQFSTGTVPVNEQLITVNGLVNILTIKGVTWFRDSLLTQCGGVLWINCAAAKGVSHLLCSNWIVERLADVISLTSGSLLTVTLYGIVDQDGLASLSTLNLGSTTGAVTTVSTVNCSTAASRHLVKTVASSGIATGSVISNNGLSGVSVGLSANQSVSSGSYQKVLLNTVAYDRCSEFATATNRFVPFNIASALYTVYYQLQLTIPTNPTTITLALYKNGTVVRYLPGSSVFAGDSVTGGCVTIEGVAGDYFEVFIYATAAITILSTSIATHVQFEQLK